MIKDLDIYDSSGLYREVIPKNDNTTLPIKVILNLSSKYSHTKVNPVLLYSVKLVLEKGQELAIWLGRRWQRIKRYLVQIRSS